eukprot:jgi/Mesvir1/19396/Mv25211-RA.1
MGQVLRFLGCHLPLRNDSLSAMYLKVRSAGAGPALPRARGRRTADIRSSPVSCMGAKMSRLNAMRSVSEVSSTGWSQWLDDDIVAALVELGLITKVECLLLELCRDGGGGGGACGAGLSKSAPRSAWVEGASLAGPADAGWAAMSFTAWAVRPAVSCRH